MLKIVSLVNSHDFICKNYNHDWKRQKKGFIWVVNFMMAALNITFIVINYTIRYVKFITIMINVIIMIVNFSNIIVNLTFADVILIFMIITFNILIINIVRPIDKTYYQLV